MWPHAQRAVAGSQAAVLDRVACLTVAAIAGRAARLRTAAAVQSRSSGGSTGKREESARKASKTRRHEHVYPSKDREKARQAEHDRRASRWESSGASLASDEWHHYFDDKWVHTQGRLSDWDPTQEQQQPDMGPSRPARGAAKQTTAAESQARRSGKAKPGRNRVERAPHTQKHQRVHLPQQQQRRQPQQQAASPREAPEQMAEARQGCHFVATCHPGLEAAVAAELAGPAIRAQHVSAGKAAVEFWGPDLGAGLRACLWLRSAIRVLLLLAEAPLDTGMPSGDFLYEWTRQAAPWPELLPPGQRFAVDAHVWSCATISSSLLARTRVRDAICDAIRDARGGKPQPPDAAHPAQLPLYLTCYRNEVRLFRDLAGASLHRRGYRQAMHRASLNEAAAAGLLTLAGWPRQQTVLADPMTGSGTLLIEAALMAAGRAPGLARRAWPFQAWPDVAPAAWQDARAAASELQAGAPRFEGRLLGNDVHAGALALAQRGAEAAGVGDLITFSRGSCAQWQPAAKPQLVVTNPPWGQRLGEGGPSTASARGAGGWASAPAADSPPPGAAWRELGIFLKGRCRDADAWVLSGNRSLGAALQLKAACKFPVGIGGMDCRWLKYEILPAKS